jgi:16S rRNA (cytosine967-C5)-methyltransferase
MPPAPAPARRAALEAVRQVREREAFGHEVLSSVIARSRLSARDSAFATRLAYGTLATQGVLDEVLDKRLNDPAAVQPRVRDVLRLGSYELLFMRSPARAVVHESVEAVKVSDRGASGLVNAVLRRVAESADAFPWGDPEEDAEVLGRMTGSPAWLVDMWEAELGRERAKAVLESSLEPAPLYVLHNPFRGGLAALVDVLESDGADPETCLPDGCVLCANAAPAVRGEALREGLAIVSDSGAQLPAIVAAPKETDVVLDVAAGRGTKTIGLQAASVRSGGPASILAIDVHAFKITELERRMEALLVPGVTGVVADATDAEALRGALGGRVPSVVLVDAPCSGLGTLRRHPDALWRMDPERIPRLAELQLEMLRSAARAAPEADAIIYTTCTVSRRENGDVVEAFLSEGAGRDYRTDPLDDRVPGSWRETVTPEGWLQSLPLRGGPDGHFVARLVRTP